MSAKRAEVVARAIDNDPRDDLRKVDRYGTRPEVLQEWFFVQKFGSAAEWVFWMFWDLACRHGEYVVRLGVPEIARRLHVSKSTVDRAIATLIEAGALRRTQLPRSKGSFREPVALTEVRLPMEVCRRLPFIQPRAARSQLRLVTPDAAKNAEAAEVVRAEQTVQEQPGCGQQQQVDKHRQYSAPAKLMSLHLRDRFSKVELEAWLAWKKGDTPGFEFSPHSRLSAEEKALVLDLEPVISAIEQCSTKAEPGQLLNVPHVPRRTSKGMRLEVFTIERLRRRLAEVAGSYQLEPIFNEVAWSIQFGSLGKLQTIQHAINTAAKLVKEGRWSRPSRMPTNFAFNGRCSRA